MIKELVRLSNKLDEKGLTKEADRLDEIIRMASNAGLQQALDADRQRESDFNRARELETDAQALIDASKKELELTPVQDELTQEVISNLVSFTSASVLGSSALMYKIKSSGLISPGAIQTLKALTRVYIPAGLRLAGWIGIAVLIYTYLLSPDAEKNRDIAIAELKTLAEELKEAVGLNPL